MRMGCVRSTLLVVTVAAGFTGAPPSYPQSSGVSFSAGTNISSDSPRTPFAEPFLAINPRDGRNLVAISLATTNGQVFCYVYASRDAGRTWRRAQTATADNSVFREGCGDPVVYFDPFGTAFFGGLLPQGFAVSRSTDGGFTWEAPVTVPGNYDREYMAIDSSGGVFHGRIYAAGQGHFNETNGKGAGAIDFAVSTDNGRTFSLSTTLAHKCAEGESVALVDLLVTSDGKLIIPFRARACSSPDSNQLWTIVSEDGGRTFSPAQSGPAYKIGEPGFRVMKSGSTPHAAIDLSEGLYHGRIYLTYIDFDGTKYVVKVAHSGDLGKSWSFPTVVNDETNPGDASNAAVAVNKDGVVGVVFNGRDDTKSSCFRLYFTASLDGGETFLHNVRASEQPTCPLAPGNWALRGGSYFTKTPGVTIWLAGMAERFPNGGETQGLVAGPDGVFHSAWINGESGVMQLWSKEFTVDKPQTPRASSSRKDLSSGLALEVSEPSLDVAGHTVAVKVRLVNKSAVPISGPFTVRLEGVRSYLKDLQAVNSDSGKQEVKASWNFTLDGKASLPSQQKSEERVFQFGFSGDLPEEPWGSLLDAHFVILGPPQR
jgi:hypothetical protein